MSGGHARDFERFGDRFSGRRICVTGGAGFIGGHLVNALITLGASVSIIDDLSTGSIEQVARAVERAPKQARFVYASILDPAGLREAMEDCQVVFHLAAMGSVPRSLAEPQRCMDVNVAGTVRVAEEARAQGAARLIFAGSSSVYGVGDPSRPQVPRRESDLPDPLSPYAASKLSAEHVIRAWARSMGLDAVTLRYFNVFGPGQPADSDYAAVIPAFLKTLRAGRRATIFGDGTFSRDFTPVRNVVLANLLAADSQQRLAGRAVNIGCASRMTIRELHDTLAELTGRQDIQPEFAEVRSGDVPHSLADISAARDLLGYEPILSARDALELLVEGADQEEEEGPDVIFRIA